MLSQYLKQNGFTGVHYIFKDILTLRAATPGLQTCIRYWDVIFALGLCYNVIFEAASVIIFRNEIM